MRVPTPTPVRASSPASVPQRCRCRRCFQTLRTTMRSDSVHKFPFDANDRTVENYTEFGDALCRKRANSSRDIPYALVRVFDETTLPLHPRVDYLRSGDLFAKIAKDLSVVYNSFWCCAQNIVPHINCIGNGTSVNILHKGIHLKSALDTCFYDTGYPLQNELCRNVSIRWSQSRILRIK